MSKLFEAFPAVSKAEWLAKITKDLKGQSHSDFDWKLGAGLEVSAFPHSEDLAGSLPHPIAGQGNFWQIGEEIQVEAAAEANQLALKALTGGAEALRFVVSGDVDLKLLLQGIDLSIISTHFAVKNLDSEVLLRNFEKYVLENSFETQQLSGSINGQVALSGSLHNFKTLAVDGTEFYEGDENTVQELKKLADAAAVHFQNGDAESISQQLFFTIAIGKNYFLQIAKLRAVHKFWYALQEKNGIKNPQPACIFATFPLSQQSADANTNLIQATTQAMSAIIGGVDVLTVLPSDMTTATSNPSDFARRMARNVQHILKMESHFEQVADPAAGSYFIENLTEKLLEGMRYGA